VIVSILPALALFFLIQCSAFPTAGKEAAADVGRERPFFDHPLPATGSIIPLQIDNRWLYHYTLYDSTGTPGDFPGRSLDLAITGMYYRGDDSAFRPVSWTDFGPGLYLYRYEWGGSDSGYLLFHEGDGPVEARGLYIAGTFHDSETVLFELPRLWFLYPGAAGAAWQMRYPWNDSVVTTIECVSTSHSGWFGRSDGSSPSPLVFVDNCHLYRETIGEYVYYHTFHPDYGRISMRCYKNGVLCESYLLISQAIFP
jgi:hypothetical protein